MPRIRTIKPEFPQSETIGTLSRDARLLFIQLWTIVDDDGRARAASRMLASLLYPYDDDAPGLIETWLLDLEENNCIRRYVVEGSHYLEIVNWSKHQKIDHKTPSKLPAPSEDSQIIAKPREAARNLAPDLDLGPVSGKKEYGRSQATRPLVDEAFKEFWKAYPKREGANPKAPASKLFDAALKSGIDPLVIISAVRSYAADPGTKPGTSYVAQAMTWLRQRRWEDFTTQNVVAADELERHRQACLGGKDNDEQAEIRPSTGLGENGTSESQELRSANGVVRSSDQAMGGQLAVSFARPGSSWNRQ